MGDKYYFFFNRIDKTAIANDTDNSFLTSSQYGWSSSGVWNYRNWTYYQYATSLGYQRLNWTGVYYQVNYSGKFHT